MALCVAITEPMVALFNHRKTGGLNSEYAALKEQIREVEVIRKCVEKFSGRLTHRRKQRNPVTLHYKK
jgi:hypothetical protein